ncbi:MAG: sortase [Patescibacteria group bacterium]
MKKISYYIGNSLIIFSLCGFIFLFYPLLSSYFFPATIPAPAERGFALWIPKIHASAQIIPNVDPWSEASYRPALKKGVALARGFSLPGQHGTVYLFAHSSGPPWEQTRNNTVFLRLPELEKGDNIVIWREHKEYNYKVVSMVEVSPADVSKVTGLKGDHLVLQTCTPIGTDWKRLLIFATEEK